MRWAGHVACTEKGGVVHRVVVGKPEGRGNWGDPDVDGKIILRRIFRRWEEVVGTEWSGLRIGQVAGTCEYGNELSGSVNCGKFLD
jgi:hypothetical protein